MMHHHDFPSRPERIHPLGCACRQCRPARGPSLWEAANHFARLTFIGLALGLALAWIVDFAVGGPGVLSIFLGAPQ